MTQDPKDQHTPVEVARAAARTATNESDAAVGAARMARADAARAEGTHEAEGTPHRAHWMARAHRSAARAHAHARDAHKAAVVACRAAVECKDLDPEGVDQTTEDSSTARSMASITSREAHKASIEAMYAHEEDTHEGEAWQAAHRAFGASGLSEEAASLTRAIIDHAHAAEMEDRAAQAEEAAAEEQDALADVDDTRYQSNPR